MKQTIKEFIQEHQDAELHLMTPGGYIDMLAKEADLLLNGEDVAAHFGMRGTDYMISAEEVLKQEIYSVNQDEQNARFYIITEMPEKEVQAESFDCTMGGMQL